MTLHDRLQRLLGRGFLIVLLYEIGCNLSIPSRPANVSASAVWAGNAFIECSVEAEANANKCTIRDAKGLLLETGLFILNDDGRAATDSELKYTAYRSGFVYLERGRFLYPVLPPETDRAAVDSKLSLLAGHGVTTPMDCGRIAVNRNAEPASQCALNALTSKKAFHVRFDLQGYEGIYSFGLAGDGSENAYAVEDYSLLMDSSLHPAAGSRMGITPCPKPLKTRLSTRGILTCLATNP